MQIFNLDFAPVVDAMTNPNNTVIGDRSFNSDPALVWPMASQVSKGLQEHGVQSCFKHFPNHGSTEGDTHEGYAFASSTLEELFASDLIPFQEAVDAGEECIMIAHISLPNILGDNTPCSMSKYMITDVLREQMGFKGVVTTDALNMGAVANIYGAGDAAVTAFKAGVDLLLMPGDFKAAYVAMLDSLESGDISEDRLDESVRRIAHMKLTLDD